MIQQSAGTLFISTCFFIYTEIAPIQYIEGWSGKNMGPHPK